MHTDKNIGGLAFKLITEGENWNEVGISMVGLILLKGRIMKEVSIINGSLVTYWPIIITWLVLFVACWVHDAWLCDAVLACWVRSILA